MVTLAEEEAHHLGHGHIGTEHLLLGILAEGQSLSARALVATGATLDAARDKVAEAVAVTAEGPATGALQYTDRARRALERASRLSLRHHADHVQTEHVLLSLLDVEGTAGQVLRGLAVDLARVRAALDPTAYDDRTVPGPIDPGPRGRASPRCPACGAALASALSHRVVTSAGEGPGPRGFLVAYCSACGSAIGATPE